MSLTMQKINNFLYFKYLLLSQDAKLILGHKQLPRALFWSWKRSIFASEWVVRG